MGDITSKIFNRLFDYPLKEKPFCAHKPEVVHLNELDVGEQELTNYDKLSDKFNKKLVEKRREVYENFGRGDSWSITYPEWNETTISYLHSLFLMFCDGDHKMLSFTSFECILECLGDDNSKDTRKNRFDAVDKDINGFINYADFLNTIYKFPSSAGSGLKRIATKAAEKADLINNLSVENQLQYGLF